MKPFKDSILIIGYVYQPQKILSFVTITIWQLKILTTGFKVQGKRKSCFTYLYRPMIECYGFLDDRASEVAPPVNHFLTPWICWTIDLCRGKSGYEMPPLFNAVQFHPQDFHRQWEEVESDENSNIPGKLLWFSDQVFPPSLIELTLMKVRQMPMELVEPMMTGLTQDRSSPIVSTAHSPWPPIDFQRMSSTSITQRGLS